MIRKKSGKSYVFFIAAYATLAFWSLLVLFPFWTMLLNSFKPQTNIWSDPFGLPQKFVLDGYLSVFKDSSFPVYFLNSILITVLSIFLILLFSSLAAYAIVNWRSRITRFLFVFFLAGYMIPIKIASINLLQLIQGIGLYDTLWSLLPIYVAWGLPLGVFVLTEFIRGIPQDFSEAAQIDGASRFLIYFRIIIPMLRPALGTVAIFNMVRFWNDLWFPLIFIRNEGQRTLMLGVTRLFGQYQTDWTKILAVLTLSCVPILVLYLLMSRQFIKGLTAGGIKG